MMRLFVAVDLPKTVKDRLGELKADIPTARWVRRQQMHLTLFFIGETEKNQAVKDVLAQVQCAPFQLSLKGVGRFPPRHRQAPRVLWVGVDAASTLGVLHQRVSEALSTIGFVSDSRPFNPHITLARLKTQTPLPQVDRFLHDHAGFETPTIAINEFVLFSSTLTPDGAKYNCEAVFPLGVQD